MKDNDQNQMTNAYFDRHEMMMTVVEMLEEEKVVVVVVFVALNMDLHMFDNKLDLYKELDEDNMVNINPAVVNDSSTINEDFV
jgi:hypothetical protein